MKNKKCMLLQIAVLAAAFLTMSCTSVPPRSASAEPVYEALTGTVTAVDKYGNLTTDIATAVLQEKGYALGDILTVKLGTTTVEAPFVETYSDVDRGKFLLRSSQGTIAVAMSYDNCSGKTGAVSGTSVVISLSKKAGYLSQYEMRHLVKSEKREDYASDAIFANFRNVKLGKIPEGKLYRGCNPVLGDARSPYAAKLVEEANIKTVINLADSKETMEPHLPAAPYYQTLVNQGQVIALNMGIDFHDPAFLSKLKDGLLFMIEHDGPYFIHCNEGKDRAGMVAAVLEALMGAKLQEIADDYMITYMNYFNVAKTDAKYPVIAKIITDMFTGMNNGKPVTDSTVQAVTERYLMNTIGLTAEQIQALKTKLR